MHSFCVLISNDIMTKKEQYHKFCQEEGTLPIFMQDWWLDAVCAGKEWDVLLSTDSNGEILAALPYLIRKRRWIRYILMPQLTQIGGLWIRKDLQKKYDVISTICNDIIGQLDKLKLAYYYQHFPIESVTPRIFASNGFKIRERITYRLEDLSDLNAVVAGFSKNKKRQLQKALSLHVDKDLTAEEFYRFHSECLQEQNKGISYTREFLLVLERKTSRLNQGQIIAIRDAENKLHAAVFVVWDKESLYYLIPCYNPQYKDSGAGALLVLEAIKLARQLGLNFDFEGSMIRGIANHYKQFGSTATKYYSIEKYYKWWFWFANAYNFLRERRMR